MARPRKSDPVATSDGRSRYHVEALARGLQVLAAFTPDTPELTAKEIGERTGLQPSTVFRLVMTLVDLGYVRPGKRANGYRLTIAPVLLGYFALAGLKLEELAMPVLQRLQQDTGESVFLSVLIADQAVDIVSLRRPGMLSTLGERFPLYCTPAGKVLLAFMPESQRRELIGRMDLTPRGPGTLTSRDALETELARVNEDGYSTNDQELMPGRCGAGAPIFDAAGHCIAAVAWSAETSRVSLDSLVERFAPMICRTAERISELVRWQDVGSLAPEPVWR